MAVMCRCTVCSLMSRSLAICLLVRPAALRFPGWSDAPSRNSRVLRVPKSRPHGSPYPDSSVLPRFYAVYNGRTSINRPKDRRCGPFQAESARWSTYDSQNTPTKCVNPGDAPNRVGRCRGWHPEFDVNPAARLQLYGEVTWCGCRFSFRLTTRRMVVLRHGRSSCCPFSGAPGSRVSPGPPKDRPYSSGSSIAGGS
jgi:hypothetical protein